MQVDFRQPDMFSSVQGWRMHEATSLLISLAALSRGLDVQFFRSFAEASFTSAVLPPPGNSPIFYRVSHGRRERYFNSSAADTTSADAARASKNKIRTKELLHRKNLATPVGNAVSGTNLKLLDALVAAGVKRFVLKPLAGSMADNTFIDQSADAVRQYLATHRGDYLLEQYVRGAEFRLFVVNGVVVSAYRFVPLHVVGNGEDTIRTLLDARQEERIGNPHLAERVPDLAEVELVLRMQKFSWSMVPPMGAVIWLSAAPTPRAVGDFIACLERLPASMTSLAIDAAQTIGAQVCAIDMVVDRKGKPFVLELNLRPMIALHSFPSHGGDFNLDVPNAILAHHFQLANAPMRQITKYDFHALKTELLREGRTSKGVNAADFATFA